MRCRVQQSNNERYGCILLYFKWRLRTVYTEYIRWDVLLRWSRGSSTGSITNFECGAFLMSLIRDLTRTNFVTRERVGVTVGCICWGTTVLHFCGNLKTFPFHFQSHFTPLLAAWAAQIIPRVGQCVHRSNPGVIPEQFRSISWSLRLRLIWG